jgi:D-lactate dehydrogenase
VIITPHNAFNTKEALFRILATTIKNIQGFLKGEIINKVY